MKCSFENLVARNLNMDFSQYRECSFDNCQISLFQCSYTIGLLQHLIDNPNNVFAFQGRNLTTSQFYEEYINYLIPYFETQDEFFPLSNILFFKNDFENAKRCVKLGFQKAILSKKFKLALYYCSLINYYNCLSSLEKRQLIEFLNTNLKQLQNNENISEYIRNSVLIENSLLSKYDNRTVYYISLRTDLIDNENECVSSFISEIDNLLVEQQGSSGEHNITITHNSPLWFDIVLAIGCSIAAGYMKDGIDILIKKIKEIAQKKKVKLSNITIKALDNTDGNVDKDESDSND